MSYPRQNLVVNQSFRNSRNLRIKVCQNLNISLIHLYIILGYSDLLAMQIGFSDEDKRKCEMLAGPHGRTIYKMLQIKRSSNT